MSSKDEGFTIWGVAATVCVLIAVLTLIVLGMQNSNHISDNNTRVKISKTVACRQATSVDGCLANIK